METGEDGSVEFLQIYLNCWTILVDNKRNTENYKTSKGGKMDKSGWGQSRDWKSLERVDKVGWNRNAK